jgi:hypothetical protein
MEVAEENAPVAAVEVAELVAEVVVATATAAVEVDEG